MTKLEEVRKVRVEKLRALCREVVNGSTARFGQLCGKSPQQLSQVMGRNPKRAIGETLARDLEQNFSLPYGYLNQSVSHD
jgi:hypothetical protein